MKKLVLTVAAVMMAAALFAGCGNETSDMINKAKQAEGIAKEAIQDLAGSGSADKFLDSLF